MEIRKVGRYAWRYGWAALAVVVVFMLLALTYDTVQDAKGTLIILLQNGLLAAISSYLLIFLVLLVFRFAMLLLYSFMDHLESLYKERGTSTVRYREDSSLPMISLVVPAYNEGPVIQAAMRALLALDYPNFEIIVVDDGSTDDTYEKAMVVARESLALDVRVITKRNGGKADALNTGMTLARGEFVLNMDGDTKLSPNSLRACIRHFENAKVGAVAGNVKVINRENIWTRIQALEYVEGLAMARKAQSFGRVVNIIPGPLGMFRKSVLQQVGGYDRDTFAEDCDLTLKLLMRGWHIEYEPAAIAWVETPSRLLDLLQQRYRWTRGILQATRKHSQALWQPRKAGINCYILWYMLFEGVMWPVSNILGNLFFIFVFWQYDLSTLLPFWWLQLMLLDVVAAAYCVVVEEEEPSLIFFAVVFRLFYINIIDISKVCATFEEWRGNAMTWGKLEREGKL